MRHDGHAPVVADQLHRIAVIHILHGHERRTALCEIIEIEVDVRHVAPLAALHIGPQRGRMAVRVGEHHLGDQFARRRFSVGGGQHRTGIDPEAQFQQAPNDAMTLAATASSNRAKSAERQSMP